MWKWIGTMGLKAVPWPVWAGMGAAVLAALIGYGALMYARGMGASDIVWLRAKLGWERQQATSNNAIDRTTFQRDADVQTQLREIERKWSVPQP